MTGKIRHISDMVLPLNEEISERYGRPKELSIDILPAINHKVYGLRKKRLVTIAGRPSMGKSSLLMAMSWCFASQGKKGMFFNLETTNQEFSERLYCYVTKTDNTRVMSGKVVNDEGYAESMNRFKESATLANLYVAESYGKTFDEIITVIEKSGDDYEFIVIDYLQKIKMTGKSERESMDKYLNQLADLAIEKDICIILGSQINRGTYDGKKVAPPMLHEMKGTSGLEEKSFMVWLLHWEYWYNNDKEKNRYRIHIAKNKDGRTGVMDTTFYPEHYRICEDINWEEHEEETTKSYGTDYFNN